MVPSARRTRRPEEVGIRIDLGDALLEINLRVPGLAQPHFTWRIGPVSDSSPAERRPGPRPDFKPRPGKVDIKVDLKADQKVGFALQATDEVGNPATFDGTVTYAVDDASILSLVDNGDGSGEVTATGALGTATLTATATRADGTPAGTGVAAIQVVAGDAETFEIKFGTPEEATPDTP